jgi:hypothetical protein
LLFLSVLAVSFFSKYYSIFSIESNEAADIETNTFSFAFLLQNLKQAFLAFTNFNYWGITGILFLLSFIVMIAKRSYNQLGFVCLTLGFLYMLLYSSHYRSYYQVHYNIMHPFETLRYSTNYFSLFALFMATVNLKNTLGLKKIFVKPILTAAIIFSLLLISNSVMTRIEFTQDEYVSRIEPIAKTLSIAKESDVIISDLPIVFHCFVSDKQRIIDYYSLTHDKLSKLVSEIGNNNLYLIKRKENFEDDRRYNLHFDIQQFCFSKISLPIENYDLIKFCYNATKN